MKPRLVVFSNCIGEELVRLFNMVPAFHRQFEAVFVRNWAVRKGFSPVDPRDVAHCDVLLYQLRQLEDVPDFFDQLPAHCTRVSFAAFTMQALWPTFVAHQRPGYRDVRCLNGLFPFGDSLALSLLQRGLDPDAALREYLATDLTQHLDLDRIAAIAAQKTAQLNARADVDLAEILGDRPFDRRRFRNALYPMPETILHMGHVLFRGFGLGGIPDAVAHHFLATSPPWRNNVPIHPQVLAHFGIDWATPETVWEFAEGAAMTHDEYIGWYLRNTLPSVTARQRALHAEMEALGPWQATVPVSDGIRTAGPTKDCAPDPFALLGPAITVPLAGARVLDVGAGEGMLALALAARGATVTALEGDAHRVAQARWLAGVRGLPVTVQHGELLTAPSPAVHDVVVCSGQLHRWQHQLLALQALRAACGRQLILDCEVAAGRTDVVLEWDAGRGAFRPSPAMVGVLLHEAGFTDVQLVASGPGPVARAVFRAAPRLA